MFISLALGVSSYYNSVVSNNVLLREESPTSPNMFSLTGESGSVFELTDLQHALAVLAVQDVRRGDVVQSVVLQRRRGRVKLGAEGERVSGAVAGSRADGADPFGGGLQGHGWALVEAVLFTPAEKSRSSLDTLTAAPRVFPSGSSNLLGLCLLVAPSLGSISSSEESGDDASVVLSRRCSCWDRYCAGVCLAARAQWSSSLCSRGRLAWQQNDPL